MKGKKARLASVLGNRWAVRVIKPLFHRPSILCITHHRVADAVEHDSDIISGTPAQLAQQAGWLREHYRTVSGDEIADILSGRTTLREPVVAMTFDDAYRDNFDVGVMLMERFRMKATFFVPTGFIETGVIPPWDRLGYLVQHATRRILDVPAVGDAGPFTFDLSYYDGAMTHLMAAYRMLPAAQQPVFVEACEQAAGVRTTTASPFMTWAQIRELRRMGHTIGAHTHTHPVLSALTPEAQQFEVAHSKQLLEDPLGEPVRVFAYPYGKPHSTFSDTSREIVRRCGFEAAFSFYGGWNRPGRIDAFDVKRIKVERAASLAMFRTRVTMRGAVPV